MSMVDLFGKKAETPKTEAEPQTDAKPDVEAKVAPVYETHFGSKTLHQIKTMIEKGEAGLGHFGDDILHGLGEAFGEVKFGGGGN